MSQTGDGPGERLARLIEQFAADPAPSLGALREALGFSAETLERPGVLREIFTALPIEGAAFRSQYPTVRDGRMGLIPTLEAWFQSADRGDLDGCDRLVVGAVGFLLLTLHGLEFAERQRSGLQSADETSSESETDCCVPLLQSRSVRSVLELVYGSDDISHRTGERWAMVVRQKWTFHRHGSTSVLLRVVGDTPAEDLALKLVLAPCLRIPEIRAATQTYQNRYGIPAGTDRPSSYRHLVDVKASTERWILMTFVDGKTLGESIAKRRDMLRHKAVQTQGRATLSRARKSLRLTDPSASTSTRGLVDFVRLEDMRKVGEGLFEALEDSWLANEQARATGIDRPLAHGDLSPSNVIETDNFNYVLVDYGPNYLYTRAVASGAAAETIFVAPEVRNDKSNTDLADFYSLAQILILVGGMQPDGRGIVPDALYMWHPTVARMLEDYLDADSNQRLHGSGHTGDRFTPEDLKRLRHQFLFELDMAIAYQKNPGIVASSWPQLLVEQRLWNGEPRRNRLLLGEVNNWQQKFEDQQWAHDEKIEHYIADQKRQLIQQRRWSVCTAIVTTAAATVVVWWLLRDAGTSWGPVWLDPILRVIGRADIPVVDALRNQQYQVPDPSHHNWPARAVALSYALLAAKVYHSLWARLSPLHARGAPGLGGWPILVEAWIRWMPVINAGLVLWVTLVWVDFWPLAVIAGQILAFFGNAAILEFILRSLKTARRPTPGSAAPSLSTVPAVDSEVTGLDLVSSWVPSSLFFAVLCVVVGSLILVGVLKDEWLYASMVAFLNLGLIYAVKCGRNGPKMRVALHRASFAAERLAVIKEGQG